jgi:hypothetical protein
MALTAETIEHLEAAGLTTFFAKNRQRYLAKAMKAYRYASDYVGESAGKVRVDDVAAPLVLALKVGDPLIDYLAGKKLTQKYWYDRFADYILDQLWDEVQSPLRSADVQAAEQVRVENPEVPRLESTSQEVDSMQSMW